MSDPSQLPQADTSKSNEISSSGENELIPNPFPEPSGDPTTDQPTSQMDVDDSHVTDALDAILGGLLPAEETLVPVAPESSQSELATGQHIAPEATSTFEVSDAVPATELSHIDHDMGQDGQKYDRTEAQNSETAAATLGPIDHVMGEDAGADAKSVVKADVIPDAPAESTASEVITDQQQDVTMEQPSEEGGESVYQIQTDQALTQGPESGEIAQRSTEAESLESSKDETMPAASIDQEERQDISMETVPEEEGGAQWEADSSPYESSSSDSSDDSSDEESDGEVLSIQETAKLLMAQMAEGSDDEEDGKKGKGPSTAQVKTKNEQTEPVPPKPEITLTETDEIVLLGAVLHVVDNSLVVKGNTNAKYRVLDEGSPLCKSDRTIIGVVADVIGNVQSPMYIVRFATAEEISSEGLLAGTQLYYSPQHSKFVFTEALQAIKGSDASNLHDEEVAGNEMEFSDDEKEQAYKKDLKNKRRAGKGQARDGDTDARPASSYTRNEPTPSESASVLNYDDEEDGPYKPLARPTNFGQGLPPIPPAPTGGFPSRGRGDSGGRGRGDFRGNRGNRGRGGRGGRGGGGRPDGYSQPPQSRNQASPPQQHTPSLPTPPTNPPAVPSPYQWSYPPPAPPAAYNQSALPFPPPPPPPPAGGGVNIQQFTAWAQSMAQQQRPQQPPVPQQHQHVPQYQQMPQQPQHQPPSGYPQYPPQPQPTAPYNHQQSPAPAWTPPPPPVPQGQAGSYNPAYYAGSAQGQHPGWNPNQQNQQGQGR